MFLLKNVRRCCYYTKIYENIKIIRKIKLEKERENKKYSQIEENKCNVDKKKKQQAIFPYDIKKDDNNFYEQVFNKIKQKDIKNLDKYAEVFANICSERKINENATIKNICIQKEARVGENIKKGNCNNKVVSSSENTSVQCVSKKSTFLKGNEMYALNNHIHNNVRNKNENINDKKYLKEKKKYLERKDVYLKVVDDHILNRNKSSRGINKSEKCLNRDGHYVKSLTLGRINEERAGEKQKLEQVLQLNEVQIKGKKVENKIYKENERIESTCNKKGVLLQNNVDRMHEDILKNDKLLSSSDTDLNNNSKEKHQSSHGKNTSEVKSVPLKVRKNKILVPTTDNAIIEKSYINVEYEEYWENEKINKILELQKGSDKDIQNKLFKGVLYVSPFDTNKCFVVNEESLGCSKNNFFYVYGYISRNRALNDDLVYAYAERRKIKRFQDSEEKENEQIQVNRKKNTDTNGMKGEEGIQEEGGVDRGNEENEEKEEQTGNFCRVVNIVERRSMEIVCTLNYLNIKEKINNTFGKKDISNKLKNGTASKVLISNKVDSDIVNYKCDKEHVISKPNIEKIDYIQIYKNEEKERSSEKLLAKLQSVDARLPCFIYESSNFMVNKILYHLQKKKINLYVLVKFKQWEQNQINPLGNISTILGSEKNLFGIIYFFIYFYKIHFHIYGKTDMSYLKSKMIVQDKIFDAFFHRKNVFVPLANYFEGVSSGSGSISSDIHNNSQGKGSKSYVDQIEKKIAYLRYIQQTNRSIQKYMIKCLLKNRDIITHLDIFTIDPLNAKDLDDALSIEFVKTDKNSKKKFQYKIGVHISDVSFFISPNSYYDKLASKICNTIYMDIMVIHMLPSILSEHICSLNTEGEKLSFSIFFFIDNISNPYDISVGEMLKGVDIKKCLIKSKYKLNYDVVEDYINDIYLSINSTIGCSSNCESESNSRSGSNYRSAKCIEEKILVRGDLNLSYFIPNFEHICDKHNISVKIGSDIFRLYLLSRMLKEKTGRKNIYQTETLLFALPNTYSNNDNSSEEFKPINIDEMTKEYISFEGNDDMYVIEKFLKRPKFKKLLNETNMENVHLEKIEYKKKSHMLIEEMMILTNFLVANKIFDNKRLGLLRIHENSSEEIKKNFLHIIDYSTYNKINRMININNNTINDILSVCEKVLSENQLLCLHYNILKYYKEAIYIPFVEGEKNYSCHFGLLLSKYIHFTSPIRRYIDIVVHRILNSVIEEEILPYTYEDFKRICEQCNYQKKKTDEAQTHLKNFLLNKYLIYLNNNKHKYEGVSDVQAEMGEQSGHRYHSDRQDSAYSKRKTRRLVQYYKGEGTQKKGDDKPLEEEADKTEETDESYKSGRSDKTDERHCFQHSVNLKKGGHIPIKKYFYLNRGVISFLTEAYIQEIVITKNIKENICLNILNSNYINVNGKEDGVSDNIMPITHITYISDSSKNMNSISRKNVDGENKILSTNEENFIDQRGNTCSSTGSSSSGSSNDGADYNMEESSRVKIKKSINDNIKLKNAIVFYVPIVETEKSVSDNLLSLKFEYVLISFKECTYIYNISNDVLFKINLDFCTTNESSQNSLYNDEGNPGEEQKRNKRLYNIFKQITNMKICVKYQVLKLEEGKNFQEIYDSLYIHDVFIKRDDEVNKLKKQTYSLDPVVDEKRIKNEQQYNERSNLNDSAQVKMAIKQKSSQFHDNIELVHDKTVECNEGNEYEKISRFQKKAVFLIPGLQMWALRLT
ncbi:exoribonuclease II [Plasmodium brasilianum]|uniref:Exoribonuclease II n=1 Tax=Plasmodium brasilianum TaxID=5824 RepID=A0ACB9YCJ8_PLABR|nr:exoribonuclease II [Plasmodium brasilianum]